MPTRSRRRLLTALAVGAALVVSWGEWTTWRGSRHGIPRDRLDPRGESDEAVIVLGFASSRDGRINLIQRWRTRIALRSADPETARFVFTGAAPASGGPSEAAVMADYAVRRHRLSADNVLLEERARTTWENIAYSIPLVRDASSIKIVSNTFHARAARAYLARQAPELAARLRRARDYQPGELGPFAFLLALYRR